MALFDFTFGKRAASSDVEMNETASEVCCLNLACNLTNFVQSHSVEPASATTPVLHVYPPQPVSQDTNLRSLYDSHYNPQKPTRSFSSHQSTTPTPIFLRHPSPTPSSRDSLDLPTTCPQILTPVLSGPSLASTSAQSVENQLAVAIRPRISVQRRSQDPQGGRKPGHKVQVGIFWPFSNCR